MVIELLGWAVIGIFGVMRAVSVGICMTVLVFVIGMSGVAWYLFQQKIQLYILQISPHGSRKWQLKM